MSSCSRKAPKTGTENKGLTQVQNAKSTGPSEGSGKVEPRLCPRYEKCSVPVCPLDLAWKRRAHLQGDKVCRWLTEMVKKDGPKVLEKHLPAGLVARIIQVGWEIKNAYINAAMKKAAKKPSRMVCKGKRAS